MTPVDIAHHVREAVLEITWDDGSGSRLAAAELRGWCPCATCQGHAPGLRYHQPPAGVTIAAIREVGAYAIGIGFSDGHDNGIFTWPHLRWIADHART